jgi:NDP-sugar pyrophosphorylase family protein
MEMDTSIPKRTMIHSVTKAMILAAGEGTRLRPLTLTMPKAMVPVAGRPLIEHTLTWLKSHGVAEVGINLHYLGSRIVDCLGDGSRFGLKIVYSHEEALLGTAGGTKRLEAFFAGDRFVLIYGDILTDLDLDEMVEHHVKAGAVATIVLFAAPNPHEVGIVETDSQGRILSFVEKPARGTEKGNLANGGVYVLEPAVLEHIQSGYFDFGFDVFPSLLRQGMPLHGYKLKDEDYLLDIGSIEKYRRANDDYLARRVKG